MNSSYLFIPHTHVQVVIANAWHHRSDVFISLAVCAGLLGGLCDYPLLDPLVGVLASGILVHQGLFTVMDSLKDLRDRPASEEETQALRDTCLSVAGIRTVEHLAARLSGPFLFVDCTVGVPGTITGILLLSPIYSYTIPSILSLLTPSLHHVSLCCSPP